MSPLPFSNRKDDRNHNYYEKVRCDRKNFLTALLHIDRRHDHKLRKTRTQLMDLACVDFVSDKQFDSIIGKNRKTALLRSHCWTWVVLIVMVDDWKPHLSYTSSNVFASKVAETPRNRIPCGNLALRTSKLQYSGRNCRHSDTRYSSSIAKRYRLDEYEG